MLGLLSFPSNQYQQIRSLILQINQQHLMFFILPLHLGSQFRISMHFFLSTPFLFLLQILSILNYNNKQNKQMSKQNIHEYDPGKQTKLQQVFSREEAQTLNFQQDLFEKSKSIVQDQIDNFKLFLMAGWLINFYIAAIDKSPMIDTPILNFPFNYRTWHWVDGATTLTSVFFYLIVQETLRDDKVDIVKFIYNFKHPCRVIIAICLFIFKVGWIIIGIIIFLSFNLKESSEFLMNFVTIYYVGFVGGLLYFYHHFATKYIIKKLKKKYYELHHQTISASIKRQQFEKNHRRDEGDEKVSIYESKGDVKNDQNTEMERDLQETAKIKCSNCMIFMAKNSILYGFFWVINLVLYFKDESKCMDEDLIGNQKLTYRKWNLAMGIIVLIATLLSPFHTFFNISDQYKLSQRNQSCCYYSVKCIMSLFHYCEMVISPIFTIIGLSLFFKLDFESKESCSQQVKQFSVAYFLGLILVWVYQIFFVFQCCFMCLVKCLRSQ